MSEDIRWIRSYVLEEGGGTLGAVLVFRDVSERRRAERVSEGQ